MVKSNRYEIRVDVSGVDVSLTSSSVQQSQTCILHDVSSLSEDRSSPILRHFVDFSHAAHRLPGYSRAIDNINTQSTQDLDIDRRRLQETLRREVEARKRVDKMLRGYKDEVGVHCVLGACVRECAASVDADRAKQLTDELRPVPTTEKRSLLFGSWDP